MKSNSQTLEERVLLSEKTALVTATQITEDENVRVGYDNLIEILEYALEIAKQENNLSFISELEKALPEIKAGKLKNAELKGITSSVIEQVEKKAEKYAPRKDWNLLIGASPAISAIAIHYYAKDDDSIDAYFVGNLVETATDALRQNPELIPVFINNKITSAMPRTLSLEDVVNGYRIMLPFSEGRDLSELSKNSFFMRLQELEREYKKVVINLAGLNKGKPEEYSELIHGIREKIDSSLIYAGTNDFEKFNDEKRKEYLSIVLNANFASMNDCEVRQLYEAVGGERNKYIGEILGDLETKAQEHNITSKKDKILIVHSANGAILKAHGKYSALPKDNLEKALTYAVNATTYKILTGNNPVRGEIEQRVVQRFYLSNDNEFEKEMGKKNSLNQQNVVYTVSPVAMNCLGDLTGAGATFDGIMMYYLSKINDII